MLIDAADRGDGAAACQLGDMYREASGELPPSPEQARRWYARSALAGDPEGQNNLGACFEHGLGGPKNYRQAAYWYRKAAGASLACASSNLGHCYLRGRGVPKDDRLALKWFQAAMHQGHQRAEEWVALLGRRPVSSESERNLLWDADELTSSLSTGCELPTEAAAGSLSAWHRRDAAAAEGSKEAALVSTAEPGEPPVTPVGPNDSVQGDSDAWFVDITGKTMGRGVAILGLGPVKE